MGTKYVCQREDRHFAHTDINYIIPYNPAFVKKIFIRGASNVLSMKNNCPTQFLYRTAAFICFGII